MKNSKPPINILKDYKISPSIASMPPLIIDKLLGENPLTFPLNLNYDLYRHVLEPPEIALDKRVFVI